MLHVVVRFAEEVDCGDQPPYMCAAKVGSMMCGFPSQLEHRAPIENEGEMVRFRHNIGFGCERSVMHS